MNTTGRKTVKGEKTSAPKAAKAAKAATTTDTTARSGGTAPSYDEIAKRSYELYLQRGGIDGYHEQDWLQAEAELSSR
ncbi:MAG TPA: DUF2934 domain-containing protein [Polyangia bacterium]|nr:DUF2934 domain-containing protein [Polyangia bacterium]